MHLPTCNPICYSLYARFIMQCDFFSCGLAGCAKKCLSVLPYIGDDENENSDADFEVCIFTAASKCLSDVSLSLI